MIVATHGDVCPMVAPCGGMEPTGNLIPDQFEN